MRVSWESSSSNNFRVFISAHWAGRWYQHHSHAQCMHIIHGLTLRLTVQADIQLWDKRRYLSSRKRGWGDNIPDKTEEKVRHRQTQRRKQKQEERQWDLHEKPKSWWETGWWKHTAPPQQSVPMLQSMLYPAWNGHRGVLAPNFFPIMQRRQWTQTHWQS